MRKTELSKLKERLVMRKAKRHYRAKRDNASCFDETFLKSFAKEFYDVIIELVKEGKIEVKTEVKEELKDELATKKDIAILEEKMNAMEERILRYVDNRFNQLDKKNDNWLCDFDIALCNNKS
jgi:hypothetical protein